MEIKCVYAGSFDPPTNGYLWMIQKGYLKRGLDRQSRTNAPIDLGKNE